MTEKNSAGIKEMIYSILWAAAILLCCDISVTALKMSQLSEFAGRDMLITCGFIGAGCVLVYFVLTRYASTFIYTLDDEGVSVVRKIGHRERRYDIKNSDICSISFAVPDVKTRNVHRMKKAVFSRKNTYCLLYRCGDALDMIEFEPSRDMAEKIGERIK